MKIFKFEVQNYRLLKNFSIDVEDELSLIIGKNNSGKTSLLSILDKFLNSKPFKFDDFNLDFIEYLKEKIGKKEEIEKDEFIGVSLSIYIEYDKDDDLSNISELLMDLNPDNNQVKLIFEYYMNKDNLSKLLVEYEKFKNEEAKKAKEGEYKAKDLDYYLRRNYLKYFKLAIKTVDINNSKKFKKIDKIKSVLDKIINFEYINAKREVSNKESNDVLSSLSSKIYNKINDNDNLEKESNKFIDALWDTDIILNKIYEDLFKDALEKIKMFGGMKPEEMKVKIASTLQDSDLLKNNTTVMYNHGKNELPENYNGLGYMNLINMIFEIEVIINKFKGKKSEKMSDINLLFIEEPEAHTHPQMQHIFINNIKKLLGKRIEKEGENVKKVQYIISTHSSHIVSESDFDDIKYLKREANSVVSKNLKDLEKEYNKDGQTQNYKFLKQYLTLNRAELFFADKAIFIEGDTERILLPAMMKKLDLEAVELENKLLSQNISIVEVGNYSQVFEKFIDFIGIKSLIITDIDSAMTKVKLKELKDNETDSENKKKIKQKVKVSDENASITTNSSLIFFYKKNNLSFYKNKEMDELILSKKIITDNKKEWQIDKDGNLTCVYQIEEKNLDGVNYHASSFEDAFFHLNKEFITNNMDMFKSLKNTKKFDDNSNDAYELAKRCVGKKPPFAIEILLNSSDTFSNWRIPGYIKRGLLWLRD